MSNEQASSLERIRSVSSSKSFRDCVYTQLRENFFDEETERIRSKEDACSFDIVLGNAPWGDGSIKGSSDIDTKIVLVETNSESRKRATKKRTKAEHWARKQTGRLQTMTLAHYLGEKRPPSQ